jgi:hypothetical protein
MPPEAADALEMAKKGQMKSLNKQLSPQPAAQGGAHGGSPK